MGQYISGWKREAHTAPGRAEMYVEVRSMDLKIRISTFPVSPESLLIFLNWARNLVSLSP